MGVDWHARPTTGDKDRGGKKGSSKGLPNPGDLGVTVATSGAGAKLKHVHDGGAARAAGLSAGDEIVAVDGIRVGRIHLTERVRSYPAGATVRVHAFRRDELLEVDVTLTPPAATTVYLSLRDDVPDDVAARRDGWLKGT
jgi:predicted metalloprotease with PDZ domain